MRDNMYSWLEKKILVAGTKEEVYRIICILKNNNIVWNDYCILDDEFCINRLKKNSNSHIVLIFKGCRVALDKFGLENFNFVYVNYSTIKVLKSKKDILRCHNILSDKISKRTLCNIIKAKLYHNRGLYEEIYFNSPQYISYMKNFGRIGNIIDAGAYTGDTAIDIINNGIAYNKIYCIEPDPTNYNVLLKNISNIETDKKIICLNFAIGNEHCYLNFHSNEKYSKITQTGEKTAEVISIDSLEIKNVSIIKMDIEGFEKFALLGAENTISRQLPLLCICTYHTIEDSWEIPLLINRFNSKYKIYLRHHRKKSLRETVCYAYVE